MDPTRSMIEAGARALVSSLCVYIDMDAPNMQHQADYYRRIAADVLRATMVGVEVVAKNKKPNGKMPYMHGEDQDDLSFVSLKPGDCMAVIRGGE